MSADSVEAEAALGAVKRMYERARVLEHRGQLITVNAFTDQSEPLPPQVLAGIATLIAERVRSIDFDVVAGEEDKGAHIATAVSLETGKPLTLARWYVYPIQVVHPTSTIVELHSEYYDGNLIVNGISEGSRILLIDDTLSTGGTLIALIRAIRNCGGSIAAAVAVVEKVDSCGASRVLAETGVRVETLLQIRTSRSGVTVL